MPPKDKLSAKDIAALERWIQGGRSVAGKRYGRPAACLPLTDEPIGDAWSDPRNPIVRLFGGQRLDLWSLQAGEAARRAAASKQS